MKIVGAPDVLSRVTAIREKLFHFTNSSFASAFPLAYLTSMMRNLAL